MTRLRRKAQHSTNSICPSVYERKGSSRKDTPGLFNEVLSILLKMWYSKWELLISFTPFVLVLAAFMTFVFWNGSIVLGAKEDHVVSPHFAQIMYFGLVSAAATAPMHFSLSQFTCFLHAFWKKRSLHVLQWLTVLIAGFVTVHIFSIAHPYLLADNRHYTFYFWRKIIHAHWTMKYLLVPLYIYSWFSIISILVKSKGKIWALLFFLACTAVLIPAPLIEFRYYTIPIIFFILNSQIDDNIYWLLIAVLFLAVNFFTMLMFLLRPFHWPHEPGIQRFIW
uniref:Dol-P-Glc:Glc(2)Man(9)GlcNAc(2)-PP-Dol alpha-1,2-glucosyltransferase n=1 Tax=Anthurium amnicola TaxID=1678845 RepID=A0A1D1Z5J7_9ARAE